MLFASPPLCVLCRIAAYCGRWVTANLSAPKADGAQLNSTVVSLADCHLMRFIYPVNFIMLKKRTKTRRLCQARYPFWYWQPTLTGRFVLEGHRDMAKRCAGVGAVGSQAYG